jgi:hypothetical protein
MAESGCLRDVQAQDLEVAGTTHFVRGLSLGTGVLGGAQSVAGAAAAEAVAATTISTTASVVTLTQTNNANDRVYLPSPADVDLGRIFVIVAAGVVELSSAGDGTTATTINGTAVTDAAGDFAKEVALVANNVYLAIKTGANAWGLFGAAAAPADADA